MARVQIEVDATTQRHMKMITLEPTHDALLHRRDEITLDEEVRRGAARTLERMLELSA